MGAEKTSRPHRMSIRLSSLPSSTLVQDPWWGRVAAPRVPDQSADDGEGGASPGQPRSLSARRGGSGIGPNPVYYRLSFP